MATIDSEPWWETVLEQLHLRPAERVLMLQAAPPAGVAGVLHAIGGPGRLVVVEPRRNVALQLAEVGRIEVLPLAPAGSELLGSFDAFVSAPLTMPRWPLQTTFSLAIRNLRPGGRIMIDLPGHPMSEDLVSAYEVTGGHPEDLAPWFGPQRDELQTILQNVAMRSPGVSEHHYMVRFESPLLLARMACELAPAAEPLQEDLTLRLIERMKTTGGADYVLRRISVTGMR